MRKITREIAMAFNGNYDKRISNSEVVTDNNYTKMYLFNNLIARKEIKTGKTEITLAGWNTNTTRERLNALCGVSITQKNFIPYLNGKEINEYDFYTI